MKKCIHFPAGFYKSFQKVRDLLLDHAQVMVTEIDQVDSLYMTFPRHESFKEKSGQLFAALQIRRSGIDFYLSIMLDYPGWFLRSASKDLVGGADDRGVLHISSISPELLKDLKELIKAAVEIKSLGDMGAVVLWGERTGGTRYGFCRVSLA